MTNEQRLLIEIDGIIPTNLDDEGANDLSKFRAMCKVYLEEFGLDRDGEYDSSSNTNKKLIYETARQVLENVANNPKYMREYKTEDITVSEFHNNLRAQIKYLGEKLSKMVDDDLSTDGDSSFFFLF